MSPRKANQTAVAEAPPTPAPGYDAWRAIPLERWYREAAESNPHRCDHGGPCGQWLLCDREEHRAGGYPTVEMLSRGTPGHAPGELIFHCEGPTATLRPGDLRYETRKAGLGLREEAR